MTGCASVEIRNAMAGDGAQACNIEMSILKLERIESPFDQINSPGQRVIALRQLQPPSYSGILILRKHSRHVRMKVGFAFAERRKRKHETHGALAIESSQCLSSDLLSHNKNVVRHDIELGVLPDRLLKRHASAYFFEGGKGSDCDFAFAQRHSRQNSAVFMQKTLPPDFINSPVSSSCTWKPNLRKL